MTVEENTALKILSIGWYVMGVMVCLMSLLPLIHVIFGISLQSLAPHIQNSAMNTVFKIIGSIIASVGILIVFIGEITGITLIFAGRFIANRKHYFFCIITSCIGCLLFPLGTVLGIFTLMALSNDDIKLEYDQKRG